MQPWTRRTRPFPSTRRPTSDSARQGALGPNRRADGPEPMPWAPPASEFIHLAQLLERAATRWPNRTAVRDEDERTITYEGLAHLAERFDVRLARYGVGRGDRVGLYLRKSIEAVAAVHGTLRAGAAYVPVDATAPAARGAGALADAYVKAIVIDADLVEPLKAHWPDSLPLPRLIVVGSDDPGPGAIRWEEIAEDEAPTADPSPRFADDTAYILFTSGSTGRPKGVTLTHRNALSFLDWCAATFGVREGRTFASHAPFHFDLSIFDIFAACRAGGALVLIGEALGKDPGRLGAFLQDHPVDVWYSAPSILAMLVERGGIEEPYAPAPELVLFAGEVFPIKHLKRLRSLWPDAAFWNLYGPTETNVCTALKIPESIPSERTEPFPIGHVCAPNRARVVDEQGRDAPPGQVGELIIAGPNVMKGYFGRPEQTAEAFLEDERGDRWYRTGDLVIDTGGGCFDYRGRRDRMVKKRGYRIELDEIEAALHRAETVERAAVIATSTDEGTILSAFVLLKPGVKGSIIALKRFCASILPNHMIPELIQFVPALPTTSTGKIDYPKLTEAVRGRSAA